MGTVVGRVQTDWICGAVFIPLVLLGLVPICFDQALVTDAIFCVNPEAVPAPQGYERYRSLLWKSMNGGHYRQARSIADKMMRLRRSLHVEHSDEYLPQSLIEIGKHAAAKEVLQTLPAVPIGTPQELRLYRVNVAYRKYLLGQALLGLKKYAEAVGVLKEGLLYNPRDVGIYFELTKAYLALGDQVGAQNSVLQMHIKYACKHDERLLQVYLPLTQLVSGDYRAAARITDDVLCFWRKQEKLGDPEGISNLELAGDFMKRIGFDLEAARLFAEADKLRQQ